MTDPELISAADETRLRISDALSRAVGALGTSAVQRMESELPWFRGLSAEDRSWVGVIVHAGVRGFADWYRHPGSQSADARAAIDVFGLAPRELTGVISLQQTVDLVRLSLSVVEASINDLLPPDDAAQAQAAILRFSREVAFATAEIYARAAEVRGAWDARLEALVVDAVLRSEADETLLSRASALGWSDHQRVCVVLGSAPDRRADDDAFTEVRRQARTASVDALCAIQGDRLVVILGGETDPQVAADAIVESFGPGPVVIGPESAGLAHANVSARSALAAHRAAAGWPAAPRPVRSVDLLPERALAGDGHARRHLVDEIYLPLLRARSSLLETVTSYFAAGASLERTARALFCHPNTVRYRLRQISDLTGCSPADPRDAFTLQIALVLGRQSGRERL